MARGRTGALAASGVEIRLLGATRISVGGVEIEESRWVRSRAKSLVKMLALEPGRRAHREVVMERFWPELDPARAANNLHKAIHAARRALEPELTAHARSRYLRAESQSVVLSEVASVDVDEFVRAAAVAEADPTRENVAAALALYGGDLMADDPYEDWSAEPRERLASTRRRLLGLAARGREAEGDLDGAVDAVRELLVGDPLDEALHRRLMDLYARSGRRGRAARQFHECREALARELGAEPEPATVALYESIALTARAESSTGPRRAIGRRTRDNLPMRPTRFFGREREIERVSELLANARLVTLTGPGGIGKTRLALEVARSLAAVEPDGVWLVELAPLEPGASVREAVERALDAALGALPGGLAAWLAERRPLLVLDNCEHVVDACAALVAEMLGSSAGVTILATSREALGVEGEAVWAVSALGVPPEDAATTGVSVLASDAVRLFVDRARLRAPDFAVADTNAGAVAGICRRLDGLPLAIELAARSASLLSPEQILERLRDRFALLKGPMRGAEPRHRSLRATLDWSYESLTEAERALLRRLTVFPGSFDVDAAEAVADGGEPVLDVLERLVDKSLVAVERSSDDVRYRLLETIRAYGLERRRETDDDGGLDRALLAFEADFVERASAAFPGPDERRWIRGVALECDNLRAAMAVAATVGDDEVSLRLCGGLGQFWSAYGFRSEARAQVEAVLARTPTSPVQLRARALYALGVLCRRQGDMTAAIDALERGCTAARAGGDRTQLARGLAALSAIAKDESAAARLLDEAEALFPNPSEEDDRTRVAFARGLLAMRIGNDALARAEFSRSLALFRRIGAPGGMMVALHNLGDAELRLGAVDAAERHLDESLRLADELDERRVAADTLRLLGVLSLRRGREAEGLERSRAAAEIYAADGYDRGVQEVLDGLDAAQREELAAELALGRRQ